MTESNKKNISWQPDIVGTINGKKIMIDYDGYRWPQNEEKRDIRKNKAFIEAGITNINPLKSHKYANR